ncbi:MAG TPA: amidophosphoribosyltransferase, partial [Candidatus Competibacter sp.]|nr:amidophosphoribosyltransferase [Candidatus Competibacter sp.]
VLLVDDSIVRGTTSEQIIQMAREAGARRVYFASAAPPVRYPNVYGIDMPAARELIAHGRSEEEIARAIGADYLIFQDLTDLEEAVRRGNPRLQRFDSSCFTGEYVTGDIDRDYLECLARDRSDAAKTDYDNADNAIIDLHNNA